MKQDPAFMESMQTAARMQHVQQFNRESVLRLLSHIETSEANENYWMAEYEKKSEHVRRLIDNVAQLQRELTAEREGRKEKVSKDVAAALDQIIGFDKDALGWAMFNIMVSRESMLEPFARLIKRHYGTNHLALANALINGYIVEESIDHEQRLRDNLEKLMTTWDGTRPRSTLVKDVNEALDDYFQEIAK